MRYLPVRDRVAFRISALAVLLVFAFSCATANLPPISSAGGEFQPEKDELRLWENSRKEETKLIKNVQVYRDPLLVDYLEQVMGRLNPPEMAANRAVSFRITVLADPTLNAFAYPHGSLYVHTGLLARMENEDQLATVLGHEMTHVEGRHMVRFQRSARHKQLGFGLAAIAAGVIVAGEEGQARRSGNYGKAARIRVLSEVIVGLGLTLAIIASVNGYGRNLEREADHGAFNKMTAAGYDIDQASLVYQALLEDHGDSGKVEAFFFGSHPRLQKRIEAAELWASEHPNRAAEERPGDRKAFQRRMRPVIREDARMNLDLGRLELAQHELDQIMEQMPNDPEVHFLAGRLKMKKAEAERDPATARRLEGEARDAFQHSIRLDPRRAGPHRGVGLIAYRNGEFAAACAEFRQYVELAPAAEDTDSIRGYILEMEQDGDCS